MKRFVSFFLSLCMVLSLMLLSPVLPRTAVSAEDGNDVSDRLDKLPDDPFSGGYTEYEGKDGSRTLVYDNGGVMTKNPDGSSSGVDFLGNQYQIASDESYTVRTPDGYSATEYADGRKSWTTPDGATTNVNTDGSYTETLPTGLVKEYDSDAGLIGIGFVGGDARIGANEYGEYKDGRITGPNGAYMEVSDGGSSVKILTPDGTSYTVSDEGTADSAGGRREITTVIRPDGSVSTTTETTRVTRGADGTPTGTSVSTVTTILSDGHRYESEYIMEYDTNGNAVENTQNVMQFTGDDGSTLWVDNNSNAVDYLDPNTGMRFHLDAGGNLLDLNDTDVSIHTTYGEDGSVVSSEWIWKDGARYTVEDGKGIFVTADGRTYVSDGKGNVTVDGEPIKKDGQWLNGAGGNGSENQNAGKVENPFAAYYNAKYSVDVYRGGVVSSSEYAHFWLAQRFDVYVTNLSTERTAADGSGIVLVEKPALPAPDSYIEVWARKDMSDWLTKKAQALMDTSNVSYDGSVILSESRAAYVYDVIEGERIDVAYASYIPVNNVPDVYIEYTLYFEFPWGTELDEIPSLVAPYDAAVKETGYSVKWDYKIREKADS